MLVAADESIRRAADPYRVRDLEAADIAVLKVQPLGGVRACLRIAEDIGLPVVVSSALETSVGLAAGVALAAALPELPYACGLATVGLLADDVADQPLRPSTGTCPVRLPDGVRGAPRPLRRRARARGALAGAAGRGARGGAGSVLVTSTELARAVVSALVEAGVREVVVAPGSRNAPLTFAAYDAAAAGLVRLHTRIDERSAGFLALGLTKVGSQAAVICTSGTAVANLHPAMLEAAHAGVRLLAVTADRPARLRGTGANQTTDQVGIFGPLVPYVDLGPGDGRGRAAPPWGSATVRCTSTSGSTTRWCRPSRWDAAGSRTALAAVLDHGASAAGRAVAQRPSNHASVAARPAHRRGRRRRRGTAGAGAGRAGAVAAARRAHERQPDRATTRSVPTACCSAGRSPTRSSGWWCSATRPSAAR